MKKIYQGFCVFEETICNLGFISMVVLVFASAIARSIGKPIAWSIDIAQLLLCWTTLIGADVAYRHGKYLGLDLVTKRFPDAVRKALFLLIDIMIFVALIIFIIFGIRLAVDSYARTFQTLKISYSMVTISLPVMSMVMSISVIINIVNKIRHFSEPISKQEMDTTDNT